MEYGLRKAGDREPHIIMEVRRPIAVALCGATLRVFPLMEEGIQDRKVCATCRSYAYWGSIRAEPTPESTQDEKIG